MGCTLRHCVWTCLPDDRFFTQPSALGIKPIGWYSPKHQGLVTPDWGIVHNVEFFSKKKVRDEDFTKPAPKNSCELAFLKENISWFKLSKNPAIKSWFCMKSENDSRLMEVHEWNAAPLIFVKHRSHLSLLAAHAMCGFQAQVTRRIERNSCFGLVLSSFWSVLTTRPKNGFRIFRPILSNLKTGRTSEGKEVELRSQHLFPLRLFIRKRKSTDVGNLSCCWATFQFLWGCLMLQVHAESVWQELTWGRLRSLISYLD